MRIRLRDGISPQINFLIIQRRFEAGLGVRYSLPDAYRDPGFRWNACIAILTRFPVPGVSSVFNEILLKDDTGLLNLIPIVYRALNLLPFVSL